MEAHPGIVFRTGPAGRRPGIAGGPDVWEVARVLLGLEERGDAMLRRVSELTGLPAGHVDIAIRYYVDYGDEIDAWIKRVDEQADEAEAIWRRRQDILGG